MTEKFLFFKNSQRLLMTYGARTRCRHLGANRSQSDAEKGGQDFIREAARRHLPEGTYI